jgi:tetratricopeptide (TPR) repeat protein
MTKKISLGLLIFALSSIVNANGDSNDPPPSCVTPCASPSCVTPCSAIPTVVCSSCPENKAGDDVAGKVMKTYENLGGQVKDSFETTMGTIDHIMWGFAAVFSLLGIILGFWGITDYRQLKKRHYEMLNALSKEKDEVKKVIEDNEEQEKKLRQQHNELENHILSAKKNMVGMIMDFTAFQNFVSAVNIPLDSPKEELEKREAMFQEVTLRLNFIEDIKPDDHTVLAWASSLRGTMLHVNNQLPLAIQEYNKAIEISKKDEKFNFMILAQTLYNRAASYCLQGNLKKAKTDLEEAIDKLPFLAVNARYDQDFDKLRNANTDEFRNITGEE